MTSLVTLATAHLKGPHVDFAGLSPLIALLGGATIVLLVGLLGSRWVRAQLVPALSLVALGATPGLTIWQWDAHKSIVSGALRIDDLSLVLNLILVAGGACSGAAGVALARRARSGARRVPRAAADARSPACRCWRRRRTRSRCSSASSCCRSRCTCCARREAAPRALARVGAEVPDRRLGRLGDAALRPGDDLRRDRRDGLRRDRRARCRAAASRATR